MLLTRDFVVGFVVGAVAGAVGYRLYEQNGGQLQKLVSAPFLGQQEVAAGSSNPSLEELISQKERLEDLIAEKKALA
ncbi:hypothetical protein [Paenibacillus turpanensis]|uniref:hypothetical protein n=1 Tax=Paenibacillus turpanensis TaxID=2689078 RepID=UPI001FB587F6|nr:hypothetical protein [Paenibacillus turpanensis]